MSSPSRQVLRLQRGQLKTALAQVGDIRGGSPVERNRWCGKTAGATLTAPRPLGAGIESVMAEQAVEAKLTIETSYPILNTFADDFN